MGGTQSQLSRYGAISRNIPELAPSAKVFLVGDSDDTTYGIVNLANEFPPDADGVVRVYSTIQAAVNAASANRGDVVLPAPNHVEAFTRVDTWATAGVQIIGMGQGDRRPALRYDDSGASVNIAADGMRVSNLMFLASVDSIGRAVDIDTGIYGVRFDNNIFTFDAATDNFGPMLRVAGKECIIEDNRFIANDTDGASSAISFLGGEADHTIVRRNYIYGQYDSTVDTKAATGSPAPITIDTSDTSDTNLSGIIIHDNVVINTDTATSMFMRLGGQTIRLRGIAFNNYFASYDSGTADSSKFAIGLAAGTGIRMINNYVGSADTDPFGEVRVGDSVAALA